MSRQLARLALVGLVVVASSTGASAQDARLLMRAAVNVWDTNQDTTGMERVEHFGEVVYLGEVLMTLDRGSIAVAGIAEDPFTGRPKVSIELAEAEAAQFAEITENGWGTAIAIVLDGRVLTAPTIQGRIPNGRVEIAGVEWGEARELAETLRELTGALDVVDKYRDQRLAARDSVDLSTPETATDSFLRAVGLADWLTTANILHPDALALVREDADSRLILEADSIGRIALNEYGWPDESLGKAGRVFAVADLLETDPPGDTLAAFSDEQVVVLMFALERGQTPNRISYAQRGVLSQGDNIAHIVVELDQEDDLEDPGLSQARVFTLKRVGSSWRMLIPAQGW
ncbi:MAG: hypothetical protein Rubg2KO_39820 [Rubricoccaceae bacterium]